jgi:hypothetical protein
MGIWSSPLIDVTSVHRTIRANDSLDACGTQALLRQVKSRATACRLMFKIVTSKSDLDKRSSSLLLGDEKSSLFETATGAAQHVFLIDTK